MSKNFISKALSLIAIITIITALVGCSDFSKGEKKAYQAVEKYQEEHYPESNEELEIEYPKLKDSEEVDIVEGETTEGEDTWDIRASYTYNPEKVPHLENPDSDEVDTNSFEAHVVLTDGEYVVTNYLEGVNIRGSMD